MERNDPSEDNEEGVGDDVGEGESNEVSAAAEDDLGSEHEPDDTRANDDGADENAHLDNDLDEDEAPVVPARSRPSRRQARRSGLIVNPRTSLPNPSSERRLQAGARLFPGSPP